MTNLQPADIKFYNYNGSSEITSGYDLLQGGNVARGSTSPSAIFRVYNNYSGAGDIMNATSFYLSASTNSLIDRVVMERQAINDYTPELIINDLVEIKCTHSSKLGANPNETFTSFSTYSGSNFDTIYASGSNYNQYEIRFNIPASGSYNTFLTSGSAHVSIFAHWDNNGGQIL